MDSYNQYKSLFDAKVHQTELGILSGLNLHVKKIGTDKAGPVFVDRYMFISNDSMNKWIPLFVVNSEEQRVFKYTISYLGRRYTVLLISPALISEEVSDLIASKFGNATITLDGEIPRELIRDCQDTLEWQVVDKPLLFLKGVSVQRELFKPIKGISSLSKAEAAAKILSRDILYKFQQKFKNKSNGIL